MQTSAEDLRAASGAIRGGGISRKGKFTVDKSIKFASNYRSISGIKVAFGNCSTASSCLVRCSVLRKITWFNRQDL